MIKLDEAMKALEGREEFAVKRRDGLVVINYLIQIPDTFDGIRREFRGVTFNETTGAVVSLPLHKFFNVNQKVDTQIGLIGHLECRVFEKFDGTMCHALEVNGQVVLASRMGWDTDHAKIATKMLEKSSFKDEVVREVRAGRTVIFEYVGPNNPVVLHYPDEELVYLWSRDMTTGEYTRDMTLANAGKSTGGRVTTVNAVMEEVVTLTDKEGFVLVVQEPSGGTFWCKAKCQWYMDRHRAFDTLMRPAYRVYEVGLQGKLDDLIAQASDLFKPKLTEIEAEVGRDKIRLVKELKAEYDGLAAEVLTINDEREKRKKFALAAKVSTNFGGLMKMFSGSELDAWVNKELFDYYKIKYQNRLFAPLNEE